MSRQNQQTESQAEKKQEPEHGSMFTPQQNVEQTTNETLADLSLTGDQAHIQSQAAQLSNPHIQLLQRQMMAGQMGDQFGNMHMLRVMDAMKTTPDAPKPDHPIQSKLIVNEPGDLYEQEADQVAEQVMRAPAQSSDEDPPGITKGTSLGQDQTIDSNLEGRIGRLAGNGDPLPPSEREFFESRLGADFGDVRVHADGTAAQTAEELGARAYTVGTDVAFNQGEYAPGTTQGRQLMAHELTHVMQQGGADVVQPQRQQVKVNRCMDPDCQEQAVSMKKTALQRQVKQSPLLVQTKPNRCANPECQEQAVMLKPAVQRQAAVQETDSKEIDDSQSEKTATPLDSTLSSDAPPAATPNQVDSGKPLTPPAALDSPSLLPAAAPSGGNGSLPTETNPVLDKQTFSGVASEAGKGEAIKSSADVGSQPTQIQLEGLVSTSQLPDSEDKILALVEQIKAGQFDPEGANNLEATQTSEPAGNVLRDAPDGPETDSEPIDLGPFLQQVELEEEQLLQTANNSRQQIMAESQAQQQAVLQSIENEAIRLDEIYAQTFDQIRNTTVQAQTDIESTRAAQIDAINNAAQTQMTNLQTSIGAKQAEVRRLGEEKAVAAEGIGQTEAQRAIDQCEQKANAAIQLGEDKATQYSSSEQAGDIAQAARQMAGGVATGIRQAGQDMATTARQDMAQLAAKFRQEAEQAALQFPESLPDVQAEIDQERQQTIEVINQAADEATRQLETASTEIITQLQTNNEEAIARLSQAGQEAIPAMDQEALVACERIDQDTAAAIAQLDTFVNTQVIPQFQDASGPEAQQALDNVQSQISVETGLFIGQLNTFTLDMQQSFQQQTTQVNEEMTLFVDGIGSQLQEVVTTFETESSQISEQVNQEMTTATTDSIQNIERIANDTETELQETLNAIRTRWEEELTQGQEELRKKIDDGLAEQDAALIELANEIDRKAEELEHQSWLDKIGDFFRQVGSFVSGLLGDLFGAIGRILGTVLELVLEYIVIPLIVALVDFITQIIEAIRDIIVGILTFIRGVIAWVIGAIAWLLGQIVILILRIVNWIADWFGGWPWLRDKLDELRGLIARLGTILLDPFTGDFHDCNDDQKAKLQRASTMAVLLGNSALAKLSVSPLDAATSTEFNRFFKSTSQEHIDRARGVVGAAVAGLQESPTDLKCEPAGSDQCNGASAYTFWWSLTPFASLHFCTDFIDNNDDRTIALVVLHEATHKYASTYDHAYFGAVFSLSTDESLENADTYEQFIAAVT